MPRVLQERSAQLEQLGMSVFRGPRKMVVSWLHLKSKQIRGILQTKNTQFSGKWCSFWLPLKQKNNRGYHPKKKRRTQVSIWSTATSGDGTCSHGSHRLLPRRASRSPLLPPTSCASVSANSSWSHTQTRHLGFGKSKNRKIESCGRNVNASTT